MFESQAQLHGLDPKEALIAIQPEEGGSTYEEGAIERLLEQDQSIAVLCLGGVQYFTGNRACLPHK